MKLCLFCKETVPTNHKCKAKPDPVFPNKSNNYPATAVVPKSSDSSSSHSNSTLPMMPQTQSRINFGSNDLSNDSKILLRVLNFLSIFKIYNQSIASHACEDYCFICTIKSYYQDYNTNHISLVHSSLNGYYKETVDLIDFPNCLSIIFHLFHSIHLKRTSSDVCQFMCIAHKLFGFTIYREIACECKYPDSISLSPNYFIINFTVTSDFINSKKRSISFVHPRKIIHCPRNCHAKCSRVNANVWIQGEFIIVKVNYDEPFSDKVFEKFGMFDDGNRFLKLNCFVTGRFMRVFLLDSVKGNWSEHGENLQVRDVSAELRRVNDYPLLMVYFKE